MTENFKFNFSFNLQDAQIILDSLKKVPASWEIINPIIQYIVIEAQKQTEALKKGEDKPIEDVGATETATGKTSQ